MTFTGEKDLLQKSKENTKHLKSTQDLTNAKSRKVQNTMNKEYFHTWSFYLSIPFNRLDLFKTARESNLIQSYSENRKDVTRNLASTYSPNLRNDI